MNWNISNRAIIIFVTGTLLNIACLAYLILGVSEQGTLHSKIEAHSNTLTTLYRQLPQSSRTPELSNRIEIMNRQVNEHKQHMVYEFGEAVPETFDESPEVVVNDRLSQASDEIERMFNSNNRSVPSSSLGLPSDPSSEDDTKTHIKKLRQIHVVKRIIRVLLENDVTGITGLSTASVGKDHPVATRLQEIEQMNMLTDPLTITFTAPMNSSVSVLKQLQTSPNYLQVFHARVSREHRTDENSSSRDDPLLQVQLDVVPIYTGKPDPSDSNESEEADENETEQDETSPDDSDSLFGN